MEFPLKGYTEQLLQGVHPGAFAVRRKHHIHEGGSTYTLQKAHSFMRSTTV